MADAPTPRTYHFHQFIHATVAVIFTRTLIRFFWGARRRRSRHMITGPCILACNHRSYLDPCVAAGFYNQPVCFFARKNLWRNPAIAFFLIIFGGLPIDRAEPQLAIMRKAVNWLKEGRRLLIFPEGTRTRTGRLGRLADGPAMFARRARVPVIPVYVSHTEVAWPQGQPLMNFWEVSRRRLTVTYGRPLLAPAGLSDRLADRFITEALRRWMERRELEAMGPRT